jgi:hypothetical protein
MTSAIDPARCPLCDQANHCGLAAGRATCWCFDAPVPADVLARVPLDARGVACVCQPCATPPSERDRDADSATRRRLAMRWTRR